MIAAVVVALVLVAAAVSKASSVSSTRDAFEALGLRSPGVLAVAVPALEAAVAALLLLWPRWGGLAAICLLTAFTAVLADVWRSGEPLACPCFGGSSSVPVGWVDIVRNGVLIAAAAVAVTRDGTGPPNPAEIAVGGCVAIVGAGALTILRRSVRQSPSDAPHRPRTG